MTTMNLNNRRGARYLGRERGGRSSEIIVKGVLGLAALIVLAIQYCLVYEEDLAVLVSSSFENTVDIKDLVPSVGGKMNDQSPTESESSVLMTTSKLTTIMTKPLLFDHDRYQYHPPTPRTTSSNSSAVCGVGPAFEQYFNDQTIEIHRSVNNEDKMMYATIFQQAMAENPQKRYTYIELGAFDGLTESNTRFFDVCLGWDGLLIEGNPVKFPLLVQNRPNAHRLNFAPGCSVDSINETIPFHSVDWTNGGLAGYAKDYPENEHIVQVPCGSLTPVLLELAPSGIDFFSLDVEGSEPLILSNIDFMKVHIDILIVESWNAHCPAEPSICDSRTKTRTILKNAGFVLYSQIIEKSDLFVHPESIYRAQLPSDQYQMDG